MSPGLDQRQQPTVVMFQLLPPWATADRYQAFLMCLWTGSDCLGVLDPLSCYRMNATESGFRFWFEVMLRVWSENLGKHAHLSKFPQTGVENCGQLQGITNLPKRPVEYWSRLLMRTQTLGKECEKRKKKKKKSYLMRLLPLFYGSSARWESFLSSAVTSELSFQLVVESKGLLPPSFLLSAVCNVLSPPARAQARAGEAF